MEAVDFRIWKKRKLPAKQQLLILLLAGILLVVVVSPGSGSERSGNRDRAGQEETETEGGRRQNNSMKDCWKKGWKIPGMRGGSRESKGDDHLEIFGRESGGKRTARGKKMKSQRKTVKEGAGFQKIVR